MLYAAGMGAQLCGRACVFAAVTHPAVLQRILRHVLDQLARVVVPDLHQQQPQRHSSKSGLIHGLLRAIANSRLNYHKPMSANGTEIKVLVASAAMD